MNIFFGRRPTISVVIRTYNRARFLTRAIISATQQTFPVSEIIVVDDCSTDNTPKVVEGLADYITIPIVSLRTPVNQGAMGALKLGVAEAASDYIAILDDDDAYLSSCIEELVSALHSRNDYDMAYCDVRVTTDRREGTPKNPSGGYEVLTKVFHSMIYPSTIMMRGPVMKEIVASLDPDLTAEEAALFSEFFLRGHQAIAVNQRLVRRYELPDALSATNPKHPIDLLKICDKVLAEISDPPPDLLRAIELRKTRINHRLKFQQRNHDSLRRKDKIDV